MRQVIAIEDPKDERISDYFDIKEADLIFKRGRFIAEGANVLENILARQPSVLRSIFLGETKILRLRPLLEQLPSRVEIFTGSRQVMSEIVGFNFHRGVIACGDRPPEASLDELAGAADLLVLLEGVNNADNVGGIIRNAAAFAAGGVVLDGACVDPFYRKALRMSAGNVLGMPLARVANCVDAVARLNEHGVATIALTPSEQAPTVSELGRALSKTRRALVLGSEGPGLEEETMRLCSHRARIPMPGEIDSLNVATSSGIALFALIW